MDETSDGSARRADDGRRPAARGARGAGPVARRYRPADALPVRHLVQIEDGRLEGLPAAPYSAGFVKSYARAVGLDPVALSP